eukprot:364723-Chlamydomonas_euryale.AAC.2
MCQEVARLPRHMVAEAHAKPHQKFIPLPASKPACCNSQTSGRRCVQQYQFPGVAMSGMAQDCAQWRSLCDGAQPAVSSPLPCCAQHRHSWVCSL